jgi:C2 domain in Dock180 and Zizimin proteins
MYKGDYLTVCSHNPLIQSASITPRISFPAFILPGHSRNDLYVTLECGEFLQDRKTAQKNVEVVIQVRKEDGTCLKNSISVGSGVPLRDEFRSYVIYHSNSPRW